MSNQKIYLDLRFIRSYLFTTGWITLGGGILLEVIGATTLGIFLIVLGVVSFVGGFVRRFLKPGYYPLNRVIILIFSGILLVITSYSIKIFMRPPIETYWMIYFVLIIFFMVYSGFIFFSSAKRGSIEED